MEHIIAYNPYKNGNMGSVSSQPLSVYDKTIAYPWMADLVAVKVLWTFLPCLPFYSSFTSSDVNEVKGVIAPYCRCGVKTIVFFA